MTEAKTQSPFSFSGITWIALGGFLFVACLVSFVADISFIVPLAAAGFAFACILLVHRPLLLLAILIVIRMSLDYSAQYFSVSIQDFSLSLSQLLGIGIAALGLLLIGKEMRRLSHFPLLFPFLLIFIWGVFTVAYSIAPGTSLSELLRFFDLFVIAFLAYTSIEKTSDFKFLLLAIFISSILPIVFGIYQFTFGIGLTDESVSVPRIFGTFSHPNVFSLYLYSVVCLGVLGYFSYFKGPRERILLTCFMLLLVGTLLLTYARVAWLSTLVFALLIAFWRYRVALIPLILFPIVLFFLSPTIQQRVIDSFHPTPDSSLTWRMNLWHDVTLATEIDHRELLGNGMDTFPVVSEHLRGARFGSNDPHNDFVKFYVEGGTVGVLIFFAYLVSLSQILRRGLIASRHHPTLYATALLTFFMFVGLLIACLSDNVFKNTPVQWLFWAALGGIAGLLRKRELAQK